MLIQAEQSILLIIDVQGNLAQVIDQGQQAVARVQWLAEIATELAVPRLITEQYPRGLGHTVAELEHLVAAATVIEKSHFSALQEPSFVTTLAAYKRQQVVICGMETHVCVLQTAVELQQAGYPVFLVEDACGSRRASDKRAGLQRLSNLGIQCVTSEMVAFEWLHNSATETFKRISKKWLRTL
jgi:nicotinamidase-related amidase